jgi:hypothetical protein
VYIFTHGVIIKSWTDDIELSENATGIGGWMGADLPPGEAVWIGPDGRYQNPPER